MTYEHLDVVIENEVDWATMNRPERLNALNPKLVDELRDFFVGLYWRRDVRVVVLRGAGRAFCAGLDLKDRSGSNAERTVGESLTGQRKISEIVMAMRRCPQPPLPASTAQPAVAASPWPWRAMYGSPRRP